MNLATTLIFYLLVGLAVATAVMLADRGRLRSERFFRVVTAVVFWPLYVPMLLASGRPAARQPRQAVEVDRSVSDGMSVAIAQVESELDAALSSLDDWSEHVLAAEHDRFHELRAAWTQQARRIRELDHLLARPDIAADEVEDVERPSGISTLEERTAQSERNRLQNVERLRGLRRQLYVDLMGTLAWVRELVTMIHLSRYTGAPVTRAEELVAQIAAAVEGLSEVTAPGEQPADDVRVAVGST